MGLFSFLRKNKQESSADDDGFYSRAEEESNAVRGRVKRKSGSEAPDPILPEKKRARRRLVGAVALVLAVVIGLPMILDSEPKPLANDIAIQIPSKDTPLPTTSAAASARMAVSDTLDPREEIVTPSAKVPEAAVAKPALPAAVVAGGIAAGAVALSDKKTKDDSKPATLGKPVIADKAGAKPEHKTEAKPLPKTEVKPQPKSPTPGQLEDAARAKAILEGKTVGRADGVDTTLSAEKKSEKFIVQVAALASQEKVNELQGKLREAGVKSYTQKVATQSGERIRIRVGPFGSKDEAQRARAKLVKLGLSGTLVPA